MKNLAKYFTTSISSLIFIFMINMLIGCSSPEDKANEFYENGMKLLEEGKYEKANVEFRNALQINKKMNKAIWGRALVAEKIGNPRDLYKLLNIVVENNPEHIEAIVKLGRILLLAGQIDKAMLRSDEAIKLGGDRPDALTLKATVMLKLENSEEAVKLANKALQIQPGHIDASLVLASQKVKAGEFAAALDYINDALKTNKNNIALSLMKIKILEKENKILDAEKVLTDLIDSKPDNINFRKILVHFHLKNKKFDKAETVLRDIVKSNPGNIKEIAALVSFLNSAHGKEAAIKELETMSENEPGNSEIKFLMAQFFFANRDIDKAHDVLNNLVQSSDEKVALKAKGIYASSLLSQGDKKAVKKLVNEILDKEDGNHTALTLKASLDIDEQKYDAAIGSLRQVLRDAPNSSKALFFLGNAYNLSGSPELADEQFFKALHASNYKPVYGIPYARFLVKRGEAERAEKVLTEIYIKKKANLGVMKLLAQVKLIRGDWLGAEKIAEAIRSGGRNESVANAIKTAIHTGKKEYDESISILQEAHNNTPDDLRPLVSLVKTYIRAGKLSDAKKFLNSAIKASPDNVFAKLLLGQVYLAEGDADNAEKEFTGITQNYPKVSNAYYHLASLYIRKKQYEKMREVIQAGLKYNPDDFGLLMSQAGLYERTGKYEKAIAIYEKLIKQRPASEIVSNNLASLLAEFRDDKESYERAYALSLRFKRSPVPQFLDTYAWASYRVNRHTEAEQALEHAISKSPGIPDFHYHLGMNYIAKKNNTLAREQLEKALELSKSTSFSHTDKVKAALDQL